MSNHRFPSALATEAERAGKRAAATITERRHRIPGDPADEREAIDAFADWLDRTATIPAGDAAATIRTAFCAGWFAGARDRVAALGDAGVPAAPEASPPSAGAGELPASYWIQRAEQFGREHARQHESNFAPWAGDPTTEELLADLWLTWLADADAAMYDAADVAAMLVAMRAGWLREQSDSWAGRQSAQRRKSA